MAEKADIDLPIAADLGERLPACIISRLMGSSIAEQIEGLRVLMAERFRADTSGGI